MDWTVWALFVVTEGTLAVTPGPAVLLVVSQGLSCRSLRALWSALGILAANALYFALSGTGVGALLVGSERLFAAVRWAGAGYLLYLAALALLRPKAPPEIGGAPGATSGRRALFLRGLVLQLSNPKALLFFVAILPQFIDPARGVALQILILGATSIAVELVVLTAYGAAAARAAGIASGPRFAAATSRLGGLLLAAAAVGLARLGR